MKVNIDYHGQPLTFDIEYTEDTDDGPRIDRIFYEGYEQTSLKENALRMITRSFLIDLGYDDKAKDFR